MKIRAEREILRDLISRLLKVVPDTEAIAKILQKWLNKHCDTKLDTLCHEVQVALARIELESTTRPTEDTSQPAQVKEKRDIAPLRYYVQGSASEPYQVTFKGEGPSLSATCSCPAGSKGRTFCKHIAWLLKGDISKLAEGSDDLSLLSARAEGSPLQERAYEYTFSEKNKEKIPPLPDVTSIKDLVDIVEPMLAGTGWWCEYRLEDDGSEFLEIYLRNTYKNGKPYKNPTLLLSISYEPVMHSFMYDELTKRIEDQAVKRVLPYVDSTNYGKMETAGAKFLKKLKDILVARD